MNSLFKEKLANYKNRVEKGIQQLLPAPNTRPEKLHEALCYSMEAGGKRIRPMLLLGASELFPTKADPLAAAVAIECIHTYSLIHDDLPSIDNSDLRRGRPSCHTKFGEATAVLAGDALLTYAFELLAEHYASEPKLAVQLVKELSHAAGSQHLIGGQMEDIQNEGQPIDADTLHYIHTNKTGALIIAALKMGLHFCAPEDTQLQQIETLGHHVGLTFQIIDDILDATSTSETLGKPVGNDEAASKTTYVKLYGITGAREEARKHTEAAIKTIKAIKGNNTFLIDLVESIAKRVS